MITQSTSTEVTPSHEQIVHAVQTSNLPAAIGLATDRARSTGNPADFLIVAHLMLEARQFEAADAEFLRVLQLGVDDYGMTAGLVGSYVKHGRLPQLFEMVRPLAYRPDAPPSLRIALLNILLGLGRVPDAVQAAADFIREHPQERSAYEQLKELSITLVDRLFSAPAPEPALIGPAVYLALGHTARKFVFSELGRMTGSSNRMLILHSEDTPGGGFVDAQALIDLHERKDLLAVLPYPHEYNRMIFRHVKIPKVFMTVRDPRQIVYSECLWMEQLALDGLDLPTKTVRVRFHPNFYEISREERLNALIEVRLPELCGFLSGWYDESVAPDLPYELRIFRHEDMKRDLQGFFGGILDFLGVPAAARRDIARESKSGEELGKSYGEHFFRLGSSDEWRAEMNAVQTERMRQIIPPGLLQKFGWRE